MTTATYKGVAETTDGRFLAFVYKSEGIVPLGIYDTAEQAAMIRDGVVYAMFEDFADLNFPELMDDAALFDIGLRP